MSADSNRERKPQRSCSAMKFILFRLWAKSYLQHGEHYEHTMYTHFFPRQNLPSPYSFLLFLFVPSQFTLASFAWLLSSARHHHRQLLLCSAFFLLSHKRASGCIYVSLHVYICVRFLFFFTAAVYPSVGCAVHLVSFCLQSEVLNTLTNAILQPGLLLTPQCSFIFRPSFAPLLQTDIIARLNFIISAAFCFDWIMPTCLQAVFLFQ